MDGNWLKYLLAKDVQSNEVIAYCRSGEKDSTNSANILGRITLNLMRLMGYNGYISVNEIIIDPSHDNYLNIADRFF
jgi:hypothetical protein